MASFKQINGHVMAVKHLKRAILAGHISHAYLICSERASGKDLLAEAFAQALQCTTLGESLKQGYLSPEEVDSCGMCRHCLQAEDGNMPDIITWEHSKPSTFSVDDVRALTSDVQIRPFDSARKVYIIPDAHLMTAPAQNALLKTLEEPPAYAHLLLLSDSSDAMLETIRSRCILLNLESDSPDVPDSLSQYAHTLLARIHDLDPAEINQTVADMTDRKSEVPALLDIFTSWYRDVLYLKASGDESGIVNKNCVFEIRTASSEISYSGIRRILDAIDTARARFAANVNFGITLKLLLADMADAS